MHRTPHLPPRPDALPPTTAAAFRRLPSQRPVCRQHPCAYRHTWQVRSPVLQAASFLRLAGSGIDGGLLGAPLAEAKLRREADGVLVGCRSRYDDTDAPS